MKKTLASLFFLVTLLFSTVEVTYAQYVVFDPTQYSTQVPQFAKEIITAGATLATQVNTYATMIKTTISGPLQDALTAIAIVKSVNNIKNLIQGGLGNKQLIKTNPTIYISGKGKDSVTVNLNAIRLENGAYSSDILNAVTGAYKTSDLNSTLKSASVSSLPGLIQKNACTDAALTARAKADVTKEDGTYDPAEFTNRKKALNDTFCVGDPLKDIKLSQRLVAANKQDPTLCGQACFLAGVSGDNEFTQTQRALTAIKLDAVTKEEQAAEDLRQGGGIASQSVCPTGKRATTDAQGKPYANADEAPCTVPEVVITPSGVLSDNYKKAITAGEETLKNTFGTGGLSSLLTTILGGLTTFSKALSSGITTINTVDGILNGSVTVGVTVTGGGGSATSTTNSTQTYDKDLLNSPDTKTTLVSPIQKQINSQTDGLNALSIVDNNYLAALATYRGQLEGIKSCYSSLVTQYDLSTQDAGLLAANAYYTNKNIVIASTTASIENEQSLIVTARDLATNTLTKVLASNSSQEIGNLFNAYQNQMDTKNLPSQITAATREGEYQSFLGNMQVDSLTGGSIYTFNNQCQATRAQLLQQNGGGV